MCAASFAAMAGVYPGHLSPECYPSYRSGQSVSDFIYSGLTAGQPPAFLFESAPFSPGGNGYTPLYSVFVSSAEMNQQGTGPDDVDETRNFYRAEKQVRRNN